MRPVDLVVEMVSWKRSVGGVRELCDTCTTTLFNTHWACSHCGFTVCIDCYGTALRCEHAIGGSLALHNKDLTCETCCAGSSRWLACTANGRASHQPADLTMTQIIPSDGKLLSLTHTHTHTQPFYCWSGICPGPPGSAGTRKVKPRRLKPIWIYWSKR